MLTPNDPASYRAAAEDARRVAALVPSLKAHWLAIAESYAATAAALEARPLLETRPHGLRRRRRASGEA